MIRNNNNNTKENKMTNARKIRTSVENHSTRRDCNGLKLHTSGVSASHMLVKADKIDKPSTLARLDGKAVVMVLWGPKASVVRRMNQLRTFAVHTNELQVF